MKTNWETALGGVVFRLDLRYSPYRFTTGSTMLDAASFDR